LEDQGVDGRMGSEWILGRLAGGVWKLELTGTIFPIYSSDVLAPLLGWRRGQLPAGPPLNPALVVGGVVIIRNIKRQYSLP
jgi:hypothetical protein